MTLRGVELLMKFCAKYDNISDKRDVAIYKMLNSLQEAIARRQRCKRCLLGHGLQLKTPPWCQDSIVRQDDDSPEAMFGVNFIAKSHLSRLCRPYVIPNMAIQDTADIALQADVVSKRFKGL